MCQAALRVARRPHPTLSRARERADRAALLPRTGEGGVGDEGLRPAPYMLPRALTAFPESGGFGSREAVSFGSTAAMRDVLDGASDGVGDALAPRQTAIGRGNRRWLDSRLSGVAGR